MVEMPFSRNGSPGKIPADLLSGSLRLGDSRVGRWAAGAGKGIGRFEGRIRAAAISWKTASAERGGVAVLSAAITCGALVFLLGRGADFWGVGSRAALLLFFWIGIRSAGGRGDG